MSGGSWDYFYLRLEEVASRLQCERDPLRKAFGSHLQKCAKALHDIEWVDSSDYEPGEDVETVRAALAEPALGVVHGPASLRSIPLRCSGRAPSSFLKEDDIRLAKEWAEKLCIPWRTSDGWRSVACRLAYEVDRLKIVIERGDRDTRIECCEAMRQLEFPNGDVLCELVYAIESGDPMRLTKVKAAAHKQADKHSRLLRSTHESYEIKNFT
jgi:hypothetical protein